MRALENCSIKTSLLAFFTIIILLTSSQGLLNLWQLHVTNIRLSELVDRLLPAVQNLGRINVLINDVRTKQYRTFVSEQEELLSAHQNLKVRLSEIEVEILKYREFVSSDANILLYNQFLKQWTSYVKLWRYIPYEVHFRQRAKAINLFKNEMRIVGDEAGATLDRLIDAERAHAQITGREAKSAYNRQTSEFYFAYSVTGFVTLVAMVYSVFRVALPLSSMTRSLSKLASGDLEISISETNRSDEIGQMAKAFEVFRAKATELKNAQRKMQLAQEQAIRLARQDPLTELPNRRSFTGALEAALDLALSGTYFYAVMLIDLDRFKPVNDVLGHQVGDVVLRKIARRLEETVPNQCSVARLGGDEFAILVEGKSDPDVVREDAEIIVAKLLSALSQPIIYEGRVIEIGASIGIACSSVNGSDAEEIIRKADIAMYSAKRGGRQTFRFFEQSMVREFREQTRLDDEFRLAIKESPIEPYYQPLVEWYLS